MIFFPFFQPRPHPCDPKPVSNGYDIYWSTQSLETLATLMNGKGGFILSYVGINGTPCEGEVLLVGSPNGIKAFASTNKDIPKAITKIVIPRA